MTAPRPAERAATLAALDELDRCLAGAAAELAELTERARSLRAAAAGDVALADIMAAEKRPLVITSMTQLLDRLTRCATGLRRAEARELRGEGLSQEEIARVFGVSRQRVAVLLGRGRDAGPAAARARDGGSPGPQGAGRPAVP